MQLSLHLTILFICLSCMPYGSAETIEEKLTSLKKQEETKEKFSASHINQILSQLKESLNEKYDVVEDLVGKQASEEDFEDLLEEINLLKEEIASQEAAFYKIHQQEISQEQEDIDIWNQEDITVSKLVMEYGSSEYLYLIPPELNNMKLQMCSGVPILRSNWGELLDIILQQSGVGVQKINRCVKQLFLMKQDFLSVSAVASKKYELDLLHDESRIIYIYDPPVENLKTCYYFLERFRDNKRSHVYQVGAKIAIVATKAEVKRLLTLCDNVWEESEEKVTKVLTLSKVSPEEMTKILKAFFVGLADPNRSVLSLKGGHDLSVVPLQSENSVVLIGSKKLVQRAEDLVRKTEAQVDDPNEVTIYWYTCGHSSPTELAEILEKVYHSLSYSSIEGSTGGGLKEESIGGSYMHFPPVEASPASLEDPSYGSIDSFRYTPSSPNASLAKEARSQELTNSPQRPANFIAHPSTGSILMVVRKDLLPKIKETLKHLDIPKRMVEIEVLLCERRFNDSARSGINLLKLGSNTSQENRSGISYDTSYTAPVKGLFEFFISQKKRSSMPGFDLVYNFLLSQENIKVTTCPSVMTINQIPTTIALTDQISINNGASPVSSNNGVVFKESYERADFGITLNITPTIHEPNEDDLNGEIYVTMENDISFETIKNDSQNRPDVHQRKIKNQVRIADGQTIILGGLRSKSQENKNDKIPFLGEIPFVGKLFGTSALNEKNNEMFIFIKPRVIKDPLHDMIKIREEKLRRRPGDTELILEKMRESRERVSKRVFQRSFELLLGENQEHVLTL